MTRIEALRKQHKDEAYWPEMPPIEAAWLLGYLFEVGPVESAGMGLTALSHQSLRAWQANLGIVLPPWVLRTLRRLSADYAAETQRAREADSAAPWQAQTLRLVLAATSLKNSLKELSQL